MTIHAINIIHIYFTWQEDCALKLHPDPALKLKPRQVGVRKVTSILMFIFSPYYDFLDVLVVAISGVTEFDNQTTCINNWYGLTFWKPIQLLAYNSTQIAVTRVSQKGIFTQNIASLNTSLHYQSTITYRNKVTSQNLFLFH